MPAGVTRRALLALAAATVSTGTAPTSVTGRTGGRVPRSDQPGLRWAETYDPNPTDQAIDVLSNGDGTYAVAGATGVGASDLNPWLFTIADDGDGVWQRPYGFETKAVASSIAPAADGGYVLAGVVAGGEASTSDALLIRTDETGEPRWRRTYDASGTGIQPVSVVPAPDGGSAVAGFTVDGRTVTGRVFGVDTDGERQWDREFSEYWYTAPLGLAAGDDGYLVFGSVRAGSLDAQEPVEGWLAELDSEGEVAWSHRYTHTAEETTFARNAILDIARTDDGYLLVGTTGPVIDGTDQRGLLVSTAADGSENWTRQVDPPDDGHGALSAVVPYAEGYACVGQTSPGAASREQSTWLVGLDAALEPAWATTHSHENPSPVATAVRTPDDGLLTVGAAVVNAAEGATDAFAAKYGGDPVETATATTAEPETAIATPTPTPAAQTATASPTGAPPPTTVLRPTPTMVPTPSPTSIATDPRATTGGDGAGFGVGVGLAAVGGSAVFAKLLRAVTDEDR
jgi:hypothetical protein